MAQTTPVRYPNGVTNNPPTDIFNRLVIPDISDLHFFLDDFDKYTAAQWVVGGVGTPVAPALVAGDGGVLSVANSAADNDNNWIQQLVTAWTFASTKQLWFRARGTIDDATQSDLAFGLQVAVAGNNFLTPTDGVFIRKDDDALTMVLVSRVGGVETASTTLGSLANATAFDLAFYYDGKGTISAALNNGQQRRITPAAITAVALRVTAGVQNGSAAARTLLLDQLYCVKER